MRLAEVRAALAGVADTVGYSRKTGAFVAKLGYFYRHGRSEDKLAAAVVAALPGAVVLAATDEWHAWPRDSWFEVRFKV